MAGTQHGGRNPPGVLVLIPNRNHITAPMEPQLVHQILQVFELKPETGSPECLCLKINMRNNSPKQFWDSTDWIYPRQGFSSEVFPRLCLIRVKLQGGGAGGGLLSVRWRKVVSHPLLILFPPSGRLRGPLNPAPPVNFYNKVEQQCRRWSVGVKRQTSVTQVCLCVPPHLFSVIIPLVCVCFR